MTQRRLKHEDRYLAAFDLFQRNGAAGDPSWAQAIRTAAMARFCELGFPVARRGNEEWKYTDVSPIARTPFLPATAAMPLALTAQDLKPLTFGKAGGSRIVFVDGSFHAGLSSLASLPAGVSVLNLAEALVAKEDLVRQHLTRYAPCESNAFTALNTAFVHDGAFIHIADGAQAEEPVHILFVSTGRREDVVTYPRVLIIAGKNSKAAVIESYGSAAPGRYFSNAVTEVVVGSGAALKYYKVQQQSTQAFHVTNTHVFNSRGGSFSAVNLDMGGRLVRNNLNVIMAEDDCSCVLNGLYMLTGSQHVDNQVIIDHAASYTSASELYKGILDGKSHSVFHGSIIVRKGLHKVTAQQVDKNLLLSDQAEADTKPAFWVYSDDVKCGHGAACGQMDEKALFYLRSRGIDENAARRLLTRAFAVEVLDTIADEPIRTSVDQLVQAKLTEWLEDGASR